MGNEQESDFWRRLQSAIEVSVANQGSAKLLGVRDAFRRYFAQGMDWRSPIAIVPQPEVDRPGLLPLEDAEAILLATEAVDRLDGYWGEHYDFLVAVEEGLTQIEIKGEKRAFVQSWAVVRCSLGEAWGGSGALQLPREFIEEDAAGHPSYSPSRRRGGGIVESLTGGLESKRSASAIATLHALSTLFHGRLESSPEPIQV